MSTARQLDQIKWMLLADMPGRADVEYAEAKQALAHHESRCILWGLCALLWISLPVVVGVISGFVDDGFGFTDVFNPIIWAVAAYMFINFHVVPRWGREEQLCGKMRSRLRVIQERPVSLRAAKHERDMKRWYDNGFGSKAKERRGNDAL